MEKIRFWLSVSLTKNRPQINLIVLPNSGHALPALHPVKK
jgi:hypothetical protein